MAVGKQSPDAAADPVGTGTKETLTPKVVETPDETTATTQSVAAPDVDTAAILRRAQADSIVKNHVIVAMSFGLVPMPLFDLALLAGNQVAMVKALADLYGVPFEKQKVQSIVISLIGGALPVLGVVGLSSGAKLIPGIGSLFGSGMVAVTGGAVTYGVGQIFAAHFDTGGSLLDLDPAKVRERFKQEVHKGKQVAAEVRERFTSQVDRA